MITGTTHTPTVDLIKSMQDFRLTLDQRLSTNGNEISIPEVPVEGAEPLESVQKTTIDYEALNADIQSRRDSARQAAVHVAELQHKKELVDIYMDASSDEGNSSSSGVEPMDIYQTSLKYSRRMDLINAFESVAKNESNSSYISVLV